MEWNREMKEIIPVIHVMYENQAKEEIQKILSCGLKKCFLISHGKYKYFQLISLAKKLKEIEPDLWIGLNFLDLGEDTFDNVSFFNDIIDAIWIDNSYIGVDKKKSDKLFKSWQKSCFKGIYFGGVAFKYCKQPDNLLNATLEACNSMDIITTSGLATGIAADINKIKTMKDAAGNKSLALASGIKSSNIKEYKEFVDYFLVASSIEDSFGNISTIKLNELIEAFNS